MKSSRAVLAVFVLALGCAKGGDAKVQQVESRGQSSGKDSIRIVGGADGKTILKGLGTGATSIGNAKDLEAQKVPLCPLFKGDVIHLKSTNISKFSSGHVFLQISSIDRGESAKALAPKDMILEQSLHDILNTLNSDDNFGAPPSSVEQVPGSTHGEIPEVSLNPSNQARQVSSAQSKNKDADSALKVADAFKSPSKNAGSAPDTLNCSLTEGWIYTKHLDNVDFSGVFAGNIASLYDASWGEKLASAMRSTGPTCPEGMCLHCVYTAIERARPGTWPKNDSETINQGECARSFADFWQPEYESKMGLKMVYLNHPEHPEKNFNLLGDPTKAPVGSVLVWSRYHSSDRLTTGKNICKGGEGWGDIGIVSRPGTVESAYGAGIGIAAWDSHAHKPLMAVFIPIHH